MAYYAALTSLLQTLEQIPQPLVREQIASLHNEVSRLLIILGDFPQKRSSMIQDLEGKIRDASYEAQDIIESHLCERSAVIIKYHISRSQALSKSLNFGASSCLLGMMSALQNMIPAIHLCQRSEEHEDQDMNLDAIHPCERSAQHVDQDMDLEFQGLEMIMDEFDSISESLSEIKDGEIQSLQPTADSSKSVDRNKSTLVGVDEDLIQLKDRLTGSTSKLDIVPIVGMGGIGKTTLARNIYNDPLIEDRFDIRAWIVVSQEYHLREIFTGLLNSARRESGKLHHESIEHLAEHLHKTLKGRRYLIVMDDVWDTKAWDDVKRYFPNDNNGSRVILTTRLSEVAIYPNSQSSIHHMSLLNSEASWDLLREKIFGKEHCPFPLEKIGKKIAENCEGLPLAIVVIGGLLFKGSRTQAYWEYIAEDVKSALSRNNDQFTEILSLSYSYLPHNLKACFLYMGVYPEDHKIFVWQLIKLWIAEGFVRPSSLKNLEEVAEEYLKDLIDRNLVMVYTRNHNGGLKTCGIHDLLRELCVKKARDDKMLQILKRGVSILSQHENNNHRVSIHSNVWNPYSLDPFVRSILYFGQSDLSFSFICSIASCALLRVIDALTMMFGEFPIEMVELVQLTYLAITFQANELPSSLSKLQNLQTLILRKPTLREPFYLPSSIWKMTRLRHLWFDESLLPFPFPAQKGYVVLENIQTLSGIRDFRCTKEVFEIMPNLKKLGILYYHGNRTEWSSYEFNNFIYLEQLQTLKCLFIKEDFRAKTPLPENLAFPPSLRKLTLSGCELSWGTLTGIGSLPNLEVLKLKEIAFEGSEWWPKQEEFCQLKFLLIDNCNLRYWMADDIPYIRLQHLVLVCCYELEEIPSVIGDIATLEMIELYECSSSAEASAKLIEEEQQEFGNDTLKVRISPFGYESRSTSLRTAQLSLTAPIRLRHLPNVTAEHQIPGDGLWLASSSRSATSEDLSIS